MLPLFWLYREEGENSRRLSKHKGEYAGVSGEVVYDRIEEVLRTDDHSIWAYENLAEGISLRLQRHSALSQGGGSGVMRLVARRKEEVA